MHHDPSDLFIRLSKWASRQGENFLTEAFAIVLTTLLRNQPESGSQLLHSLTDGFLTLSAGEAQSLVVETQNSLATGRPDLSLTLPDCLVYVEVKDYSGLGEKQLERYLNELRNSRKARVRLILLTREFLEHDLPSAEVVSRRWFHVGDWLEELLASNSLSHPESRYLVTAFLCLLRSKGMLMQKVDPISPTTTQSLSSLCLMLEEIVKTMRIQSRRVADWGWMGLYLDNCQFGVGVRLANPEAIEFMTAQFPVAFEVAQALPVGQLVESEYPNWTKGPYRWRNILSLSANQGEFYLHSRSEQFLRVEAFVRESRGLALTLRDTKASPSTVTLPEAGPVM